MPRFLSISWLEDETIISFKTNNDSYLKYIKMGLGIYEQSLLLFTNASEDVITKSEAREVVLHYKTYSACASK